MEIVLACEQIRGRQAHERETRAIRPAPDRLLDRRQADGSDCPAGALDDVRVMFQHFPHVAILLLDLDLDARSRLGRNRVPERANNPLLLAQVGGDVVAQQHAYGRAIDGRLEMIWMHEPVVSVGRLG